MLEAYLDESANDRIKPRIFVVGGWLGNEVTWRTIEAKWQHCLSAFGVLEFRSADCLGGYGQFASIPAERRTAFRAELLNILTASDLRGVSGEITLDETGGRLPKRREYLVCLFECMAIMADLVRDAPAGQRIAFLVDERAKHIEELNAVRKDLRVDPTGLGTGPRIGPVAFDRSIDVIPIQAADLLAHEIYLQRLAEIERRASRAEYERLQGKVRRSVMHWDQAARRLHTYGLDDEEDQPEPSA